MPRMESDRSSEVTVTVRCSPDLKQKYKESVDNMSDDLRAHMTDVAGDESDDAEDAHLPDDENLAAAYTFLDAICDPDTRRVATDVAETQLAGELNIPKAAIRRSILKPLERRGYIKPRYGAVHVFRPSRVPVTEGE